MQVLNPVHTFGIGHITEHSYVTQSGSRSWLTYIIFNIVLLISLLLFFYRSMDIILFVGCGWEF